MFSKFFKSFTNKNQFSILERLQKCSLIVAWIVVSFIAVMMMTSFLYVNLEATLLRIIPNKMLLQILLGIFFHTVLFGVLIFIPKIFKQKNKIREAIEFKKEDLGKEPLPTWRDILITPGAYIVYMICSVGILAIILKLFPNFNVNQAQDLGFSVSAVIKSSDRILAFILLVVMTPIVEEIVFRGYLFSKLQKYSSLLTSTFITSLLFGIAHFAWNVGIDTFMMSFVLCLVKHFTKSIHPCILLHMLKNGIAFTVLFLK